MDQLKHSFPFLYQNLHEIFPSTKILIFLLLLLPLVYAFLIKLKRKASKLHLPPSPPKLPIIGNLHQIGTLPHRSLRALSEKYGPLMLLNFGSFPTLIVSSSEVVEEIMKKHDDAFSNRPFFAATNLFAYGGRDVVFCPYGDSWRQSRKICVIQLLSQRMVKRLGCVRDEEVANMLKQIELSCLDGSAVDFHDMFYTLSVNTICRSAAGDGYKVYGKAYKELVKKAQKIAGSFCFADLFPYLGWMDRLTGYTARLKSGFKDLDNLMDRMIDEHAIRLIDDTNSGERAFVDILLRLQRDGMLDIDLEREDIKAIIQSMFAAATDTVASLLEWIMAELMKHPDVMQKAKGEVRRVVGNKAKISETDIGQMHYLKCAIKESMRLHALALFPRETTRMVRLNGYDIPPKTRVMFNNWAVQRDDKVWEKADEFIPERFEDIKIDFKGQTTRFIPFGFGRRSCPGIAYALATVENAIANLLYWYDWELPGGAGPESLDLSETYAQAIYLKYPLRLVPKPRFSINQSS